jgi:multimeric flavodoxin WrbA
MTNHKDVKRMIESIRGKRVLFLTTSNRWSGLNEKPKSTALAESIADEVGAEVIDVSKLHIYMCEGNVSTAKGNTCGLKEAALKDPDKNPTGHHRCWASINHADDELWKISKAIFESDVVIFFASVRWGQTNAIYQKLIERLCWLENRHSTLKESNLLEGKLSGIVLVGHNWNGESVLSTQKQVLEFYGFTVPPELSGHWKWTNDIFDETEEGYLQDRKDFESDFQLGPKWLKESYQKWFEQNN